MTKNRGKIKNDIKSQIFNELFVYNNVFNNFLSQKDLESLFFIDTKNKIVQIKSINKLLQFIYQFENKVKDKILGQSKFQKKTRSYGVLSIYIFILTYLIKYLKIFSEKDINNINNNNGYNNFIDIKVSSYDFNKVKKNIFNKTLDNYLEQQPKIITIFDLWDIILFYQLNNGFLNQYIFNSFLDKGFDVYKELGLSSNLYGIKQTFTLLNNNSSFGISMFNEDNNNVINYFERKNSYNMIFLDYKDFNKKDFGQLIKDITYYLEENKENIFYNNIKFGINGLSNKDLEMIQKNIQQIKKDKKFNTIINFLPKKVLRLIYSSILMNPYIDEIERTLKKQKITLVKDIDKQTEKFYKDLIIKTLNEFNKNN